MRPRRIILVRHGESEGNVNPKVYETTPDHKIALTMAGFEQAIDAGKKIKALIGGETCHYYLSPHRRSRDTFVGIVGGGELPVHVPCFEDPRLREQEWGHLRKVEDTEKIKQERKEYGPFYYRFPNGESGADVYDRVSAFLETLHRDFQNPNYADNAIIVSHGLTVRLFIMRWFHKTVEEFEAWANPENCQMFVMNLMDPFLGRQAITACYKMPEMPISKD